METNYPDFTDCYVQGLKILSSSILFTYMAWMTMLTDNGVDWF